MQNFDMGQFNLHQLKFTVDALERMGEHVLVILPQKYSLKQFSVPSISGGYQKQTPAEMAILDELKRAGKLFLVPSGCLDDLYWMYASVSSQKQSRQGKDLYIAPGNADGRWPGSRPMLISNDLMRDHKLALLEPRLFRRWYSNFIVNFTFSAFVGDQCLDREIGFSTADFYSREIQGNRFLTDDGVDAGMAWHFPVSDWEENESFCIRIPQ
jgi:hypothetical protein